MEQLPGKDTVGRCGKVFPKNCPKQGTRDGLKCCLVGGELLLILVLIEEAKQFVMLSNFVGERKKFQQRDLWRSEGTKKLGILLLH
jgi:hypothetical protein